MAAPENNKNITVSNNPTCGECDLVNKFNDDYICLSIDTEDVVIDLGKPACPYFTQRLTPEIPSCTGDMEPPVDDDDYNRKRGFWRRVFTFIMNLLRCEKK